MGIYMVSSMQLLSSNKADLDTTSHTSFEMPLVKIDLIKGERSPEEIKKLADVVQDVLIETFAAPTKDRYQVHMIAKAGASSETYET